MSLSKFLEYLPFIIGLIYILTRGKKKENTSTQPPTQPKFDWKDIIEEVTGQKNVVTSKTKPRTFNTERENTQSPKKLEAPVIEYNVNLNDELESVYSEYKPLSNESEMGNNFETVQNKSLDEELENIRERILFHRKAKSKRKGKKIKFNSKDAIIFEAILNRPRY